jgi:hypothetical protein
MIIGICGFIGSGKDTVADYLVNFHGFRRESFASSLKDAVSAVFGWNRTLLEGRTAESREWREQEDEWWTDRLGRPITPRYVLQNWGTEVLRAGFHDDIWIASVENKIRNTKDNIVITDCRFPNEIKALRATGGKVIRVKRGDEPHWYQTAIEANSNDRNAVNLMKDFNVHYSESAWVGTDFDVVLENSTSIDSLYQSIRDQVLDLPASK